MIRGGTLFFTYIHASGSFAGPAFQEGQAHAQ